MASFDRNEKARLYQLASKAYRVDTRRSVLTDPRDIPFVVGTVETCIQPDPAAKIIRIGVAGSQDGPDWINNFKAYPATKVLHRANGSQMVRVHRKYWKEARRYFNAIKEHPALFNALRSDYLILFAGHSRGGTLATYIALLLQRNLGKRVAGMTFGAPRPFCKVVHDNPSVNFLHCVNSKDAITATPFHFFGRPWHWGSDQVDRRSIERTGTEHSLAHYGAWID